ncbi:MAG: glycosyltransferase [Crocinitomicaceae bacterium]|nr:glycosyltransferase [Crocinitomicaceae bacterium]
MNLEKYISESGVYILPSKFEPWGVSVQEFAISGFPLLLSDAVGAADRFMDDKNGLKFKAVDESEIIRAMKTTAKKSDQELIEMGKASHEKGISLNQKIWCETILSVINK